MSNFKQSAADSEEFDEEHLNYLAHLDKKHISQMDSSLIRRLSDPPKVTAFGSDASPSRKLVRTDIHPIDGSVAPGESQTEKWRSQNTCTSLGAAKVAFDLPAIDAGELLREVGVSKALRHGKLTDANRTYYAFFVAPYVYFYIIATNQLVKASLGDFLSNAESPDRIDTLSLQRYRGHDLLLLLTSDLHLVVLLIERAEETVRLHPFEPRLTQKIRTKNFSFKNGAVYFRHENEVHSVVLGEVPEVVPPEFVGRHQLTFYCRQFDRFDSFDVTDNAKIIYILNNDRISVNTPTFLLYVFKPKLEINEHIKVLRCLAKDYLVPEEDSTALNDFVFTLTNMNKLFVHDGALMSKSTEPEFRVGKFDLVEVFKLQKIEGQFTDFRIFPRAKLIVLKHSHLKDFFCLTISRAFMEAANSDDLLLPEPKGEEKTVVRISKDYCGKSTSSIQRMSESKKSTLGRVNKVYHTGFFASQFVVGNSESLSVTNWCVRNRFGPEEDLKGEETNPGNYDLLFFGIDAASRLFAARVDIGGVLGDQVSGARDVRMDLTKIFNAQKVDNSVQPEAPDREESPGRSQGLDSNDPFEKGNSIEIIPIKPPEEPKEQLKSEKGSPKKSEKESLPEEPAPVAPPQPDAEPEIVARTEEQLPQETTAPPQHPEEPKDPPMDIKDTILEEVDESDRKASEDPFPKDAPEKPETSLPATDKPKKSKQESKIDRRRQEEFANELKDYLVEYHKQSVESIKGFVGDFRRLFLEEVRGAVTEHARSLGKTNCEQVLRSIEHSLTNQFEKSLKKMVEKYNTTCEKTYSRLTSVLSDEEEGLNALQRQLSGLTHAQVETSRRIKEYSDVMVEVARNHQTQQSASSLNATNLRSIYQGLSKILEQQKSLSDEFQVLSRKVESLERKKAQGPPHLSNLRPPAEPSRRDPATPYPQTPQFTGEGGYYFAPPPQVQSFKGDDSFSLKGMQIPANSRGFTFGGPSGQGGSYQDSHYSSAEVNRGDRFP